MYREINERTSSRGHKKPYPHDDSPTRSLTGKSSPDQTSLGFRANGGNDQGTFKTGGLIKKVNHHYLRWNKILTYNFVWSLQTITVIVQESVPEPTHLHLISYYTSDDIRSGKLKVSQMDKPHLCIPLTIDYCRDRRRGRTLWTYTCHLIFFVWRPFVFLPRWRWAPMESPGLCKCSIDADDLFLRTAQ